MNEKLKLKELECHMEQATALEQPIALDTEASAWREGWSALGKLLEANDAAEMKILERLLDIPHAAEPASKPVKAKVTVRKMVARFRQKCAPYLPTVSATLVVSVILAIGMWRYWPKRFLPPEEQPIPIMDIDLAWNDIWDFRASRIEEQIALSQYDSASLGSSFDNVRSQVDSLSRELDQNPL